MTDQQGGSWVPAVAFSPLNIAPSSHFGSSPNRDPGDPPGASSAGMLLRLLPPTPSILLGAARERQRRQIVADGWKMDLLQ